MWIKRDMILPIVRYGDPVLRQKGQRIGAITPEIRQLAEDMIETMREAHGVGLAAQQVGRALQMCVIEISAECHKERPSRKWVGEQEVDPLEGMPLVVINPVLTLTKKKEVGVEGCLSFPGISADISRAWRVGVVYEDLEGRVCRFDASGLLGRALQHEVDHLNGVLFIDRMEAGDRAELREEIEAIRSGKAG